MVDKESIFRKDKEIVKGSVVLRWQKDCTEKERRDRKESMV